MRAANLNRRFGPNLNLNLNPESWPWLNRNSMKVPQGQSGPGHQQEGPTNTQSLLLQSRSTQTKMVISLSAGEDVAWITQSEMRNSGEPARGRFQSPFFFCAVDKLSSSTAVSIDSSKVDSSQVRQAHVYNSVMFSAVGL